VVLENCGIGHITGQFGFQSCKGAGLIVGLAIALVWGWLPGLLCAWFGNLFIGTIHNYLSLMASVRYDGSSTYVFKGCIYFMRS